MRIPLLFLSFGVACSSAEFATTGSVLRLKPEMDQLIAPDAQIEVLASGFGWAEGPVWDKAGARLLFSDVPNNVVHSWSEQKGLGNYLKPSGFTGPAHYSREPGSNGLAFDSQGRLLSCEHGDRRLSILTKGGGKRKLADAHEGERFNSPNDLAVHSSGAIFFTDPPYGLEKGADDPTREKECFGVYRWDPTGEVSLVISDLERPNGVTLSPDEKTLYIAQSHGPKPFIYCYQLDGELGVDDGKILFNASDLAKKDPGMPDGLKVDQSGNIWSNGPGGVLILSPEGELLGRILTERRTANLAWGGADGSVLYLTANHDLLRIQTLTKGPGKVAS